MGQIQLLNFTGDLQPLPSICELINLRHKVKWKIPTSKYFCDFFGDFF